MKNNRTHYALKRLCKRCKGRGRVYEMILFEARMVTCNRCHGMGLR